MIEDGDVFFESFCGCEVEVDEAGFLGELLVGEFVAGEIDFASAKLTIKALMVDRKPRSGNGQKVFPFVATEVILAEEFEDVFAIGALKGVAVVAAADVLKGLIEEAADLKKFFFADIFCRPFGISTVSGNDFT